MENHRQVQSQRVVLLQHTEKKWSSIDVKEFSPGTHMWCVKMQRNIMVEAVLLKEVRGLSP